MERQEPLFKFRGENKKVISQKLKKMLEAKRFLPLIFSAMELLHHGQYQPLKVIFTANTRGGWND